MWVHLILPGGSNYSAKNVPLSIHYPRISRVRIQSQPFKSRAGFNSNTVLVSEE